MAYNKDDDYENEDSEYDEESNLNSDAEKQIPIINLIPFSLDRNIFFLNNYICIELFSFFV